MDAGARKIMSGDPKLDELVIELITGLGLGGAERVAVELTRELQLRDINVRLVSLTKDTRILEQYPEIGDITHVFDMQRSPLQLLRVLIRIRSITAHHTRLIVHAHMFHALVVAVLLKLFRPGVSVVFTSHSYGGFTFFRRHFVKLTSWMRTGDIVFAANQHPDMNAARTYIIPNFAPRIHSPLSIRRKPPERETPVVFAFVGRMIEIKNPLAVLEAFKTLTAGSARLIMVGDGPLLKEARSYVAHHKLESHVDILGPRNDVGTILDDVDVLVMASKWEGLPMVILEAGARGIPVIAPPVGAIPELLLNDCGYIVNENELPKIMQHVAENYNEALAMGCNLKNRISEHYSATTAVKNHIKFYFST